MLNAVRKPAQTGTPAPATSSRKVLVADDNRDTVLTLVTLLRDEGHDARGVCNAADVLALARRFDPDVFILDIAMPGRSGYDLAKAIRESYAGRARPLLIAISGEYTRPADALLSRMVGFDHHVIKPYDPVALMALLGWPEGPQAA